MNSTTTLGFTTSVEDLVARTEKKATIRYEKRMYKLTLNIQA